jgi:glutamyl-tRNA synthetase
VVDDIEFGVTHVIRGEDHVTNTAVQIQIFEALAAAAPRFGHNLLTDSGGEGLSKRSGALSIASLRERGVEAVAVAALAVLVDSAEAVRPAASLDELAAMIDLSHLSRGAARFDEAELDALSARTLHHLPYASVAGRLAALGVTGRARRRFGWRCGGISVVSATRRSGARWWRPTPDPEFFKSAASFLPGGVWDQSTWGAWTGQLGRLTGRKGPRAVSPLAYCANGTRSRPRTRGAAADDRTC